MFNFFRKKSKAPNWGSLPIELKRLATSKIIHAVKNLSGARYKVVSGSDELQREQGMKETVGEDQILSAHKRAKLLNLTRNALRNNPTFVTILKQFDLHGVGNIGGKAVLTFQDRDYSKLVREAFARWTRSADFFDGLNLNTLLKLILKTEIVGGDLVLLFDDGLITDSGKLIMYEPDEIGDTTKEELERHYGKGSYQSQGRVYTRFSQFQGVIVSRSQRGNEVFDSSKSYFLKRNPNGNVLEDLWIMPRNVFRIAQGRGVSQATSSLSTIIDLQDYLGYEIASAKKNAQTLASVTSTQFQEQAQVPSPFGEDTDFSDMTDEQIEQVAKEQEEVSTQTVTLDKITAAGCIYQVIPDGYKLELLDTKHPNVNSIDFVRWLAASSAAPYGLTNVYATLKCDSSYTAFRGEQQIAQPAFEEAQHFLEQICDWILYRWATWAVKKGIIPDKFEDGWLRKVSWNWPKMEDVDAVKEQNAINMKLKNGTGCYAEIYGADWQERLEQVAEEIKFCTDHGILHPSQQTVSGAIVTDVSKSE